MAPRGCQQSAVIRVCGSTDHVWPCAWSVELNVTVDCLRPPPSVCWPTSRWTTTARSVILVFKGSLGYCQTTVAKFTTPGVNKLCIIDVTSLGAKLRVFS